MRFIPYCRNRLATCGTVRQSQRRDHMSRLCASVPSSMSSRWARTALLLAFGDPQSALVLAEAGFNSSSSLVVEVAVRPHDAGLIGRPGYSHQGQDVLVIQSSKEQNSIMPAAFAAFPAYPQPTNRADIVQAFLLHPPDLPVWSVRIVNP